MRRLFLSIVKIYWKLTKNRKHRCIFKESCSKHVYRITDQEGFLSGIRALKQRYRQCRPGYILFFDKIDKRVNVKLADDSVVDRSLLIESL